MQSFLLVATCNITSAKLPKNYYKFSTVREEDIRTDLCSYDNCTIHCSNEELICVHDTTLLVKCKDFHNKVGNAVSTCQGQNQWFPPLGQCVLDDGE